MFRVSKLRFRGFEGLPGLGVPGGLGCREAAVKPLP